ncbi:MFS transporter [Paenibacillus naphthalenovorans]|uniref:MFS transporter n=1 Tax=Paenibacillus naphthalenovorans TaxID=162209 RepID=A0A0U2UKR1_9BACL|nr:MFS transporter [Paenibacillus naphthalenovorans]ALS22545.1 MFS transporter [Paenibacillus naphthalenovorans]GCL70339.1 MFS transporter [Paenibacillus naphthalenovorans]SDH85410.1 Major Facilitator Superfamily protein [Paenibacillus naphthalenovorans]
MPSIVQELWQLIVLRFCTGVFLGGMTPSIHVLIRRYAPNGMESCTFSYSHCALFLGGMVGSMGMGVVASYFGLPMIFIFSAVFLLINQTVARKIVADAAVLKE